jgi:hypothetical protein
MFVIPLYGFFLQMDVILLPAGSAGQFEAAGALDVLQALPFDPDAPAVEIAIPVKINAAPAR